MSEQNKMDAERAAFDTWFKQHGVGSSLYPVSAWEGWQARASLPVGVPDGLIDELRNHAAARTGYTTDLIGRAADAIEKILEPTAGRWAIYKEKYCGCKDASRLNRCRGLDNCELPCRHPDRNTAAPAAPTVKAEQPERLPQEWWQIIRGTLRYYRMSTRGDGEGGGYPLIDAMTADGQSLAGGIKECTYLADAIWNALLEAPSLPAAGSAVEDDAWLQEWARDKFTATGGYKPKVYGRLYGNTDWALARALHADIVAALSAQQSAPERVSVPRELAERIAKPVLLERHEDAHADACAELRALLASHAQAPHSNGVEPSELREAVKRFRDGNDGHGRGEA